MVFIYTNKKNSNERGCRDNKTEKAQEQDWDDTLATKLHITTLHKYMYKSYMYTCS